MLSLGMTEFKNTVLLVPSKLCQMRAEDVESRRQRCPPGRPVSGTQYSQRPLQGAHLDARFRAHSTASARSKVPHLEARFRAHSTASARSKVPHLDARFRAHSTASARSKGRGDAEASLLVQTVNSASYLELGSSFLCKSTRRQLSTAAVEDTPEARAVGARREGREGLGARPDKAPLTAFLGIHDVQGKQHGVGERGRLFLTCKV